MSEGGGGAVGPAEELREALGSGDVNRVKRAIKEWGDSVRGAPAHEDRALLAEALAPLAAHPVADVRQGVAQSADLFPDAPFDAVLGALVTDDDQFVRVAMGRAAKLRAARRTAHTRQEEHEKVVTDLLAQIEKNSNKQTRRLAERAIRRSKEYFVSKLHHEASKVVTPLEFSLNRLRSEVARPDPDRAVLAHHVAIAWDRHSYLWAIIDRARQATVSVTPRFVHEPLFSLIEEARTHLAVRLGERAGALAFGIDVDPLLRLDADRPALLQALQNFVQNAAEAYPDEAVRLDVAVSARLLRAGSQVEVVIADRGVGITDAQRERLFVPFATGKPRGTGVGLIIARTMVEEVHGGTLSMESTPGVGTQVKLVLPARQSGRVARV